MSTSSSKTYVKPPVKRKLNTILEEEEVEHVPSVKRDKTREDEDSRNSKHAFDPDTQVIPDDIVFDENLAPKPVGALVSKDIIPKEELEAYELRWLPFCTNINKNCLITRTGLAEHTTKSGKSSVFWVILTNQALSPIYAAEGKQWLGYIVYDHERARGSQDKWTK